MNVRLLVLTHNRLRWMRCLVRVIEFSDETVALGWRWTRTVWCVNG